jgi:3-(3-hydroxy-phenyl)propionate hydroxylase
MINLALRMGRIMGPKSRLHGFITQRCLLAIGLWPAAKSFFAEMKYKPKPKFQAGYMLADGLASRKTLVGRMIVQPEVTLIDGNKALLDKCLGAGFSLLGIGIDPSDLRRACKEAAVASLSPRCVVICDVKLRKPIINDDVDVVFVECYPQEFEPYRGRILLIRPDRYVVTSGFVDGIGSFASAVKRLCSVWPPP